MQCPRRLKRKKKRKEKTIQEKGLLGYVHDLLFTKMKEDSEMLKQAMDYLKNKQEKLKEVSKSSESTIEYDPFGGPCVQDPNKI